MEDEVDRIVDAWRRERPDLDPVPLHVFSRISRLARHLELARRSAFASRGLEPWAFDVLSALRRAGDPYELTPGVLMSQTLVSSGTMTNRIDRLAAAGLLERDSDPTDRRVVVVRLTAPGVVAVDAAMADLLAHESQLLAGLGEDERRALTDALRTLMEPFDQS
jgi:DNA-binding MarR family transcriptional regulator